MTGNIEIIRHSYTIERAKKVYAVYELSEPQQKKTLTDLIRIEQFRKFSNGKGFDNYLRLRNTNNWNTCEQVTGLFKTSKTNIFFGDRIHSGKKNLLIFLFSNNRERLVIDYYVGYYPKLEHLRDILAKYNKFLFK